MRRKTKRVKKERKEQVRMNDESSLTAHAAANLLHSSQLTFCKQVRDEFVQQAMKVPPEQRATFMTTGENREICGSVLYVPLPPF